MSNPSDNLDVTKGATLRDNASVVIKQGGPIDLEEMSMGLRKMSLQTYK